MKVFLISHAADIDGIMPVILTDLTFDDYDYKLLEIDEVDEYIQEAIKNNEFAAYDQVFMTDLCVGQEVAQKIDNLKLKEKFLILDHHISNTALNSYDFINVIDEDNGIKESGTSLYYKYLLSNYPNDLLLKNSVAYMVSLVRLADTWEWKKYDVKEARDLATLHAYYGNDKFINYYINFLRKNKEFYFNDAERILIDLDNQRCQEYIEEQKKKIIFREINGQRVGIVFAELFRSELGNALAEFYQDKVDLIMIININRGLSFRSIETGADVNVFATSFGGGGHVHAAGASLPDDLKEKIISYIIKPK